MIGQRPDSLQAVLDKVFAAPAYHWVSRPEHFVWLRHAWAAVKAWFTTLGDAHPLELRVVVYVAAALMLAVVLHAGWRFFHDVRDTDQATGLSPGLARRHDEGWYRREADRLARSGQYAEAVQADFLALVMALDAQHALRFHPSKTPAEYARESQLAPGPRAEFGELVRRLYAYAFARVPCGPQEFADWRERSAAEHYAPAH
jgi:hypothetical protein